jgi:uncharacterized protein
VRVCLDTNVLVAAFATRGLCADVLRTVLTEHELVLGEVVLTEFRRALTKKLRIPEARVAVAEATFHAVAVIPTPDMPSPLPIRDQDDRWIVATAIDGRADVLVTGDDDLLSVAEQSPIPIITPRAFWERIRDERRK